MAHRETASDTSGSETETAIYLPGKDGTPGAGGYITESDINDAREDPVVAARLERVERIVDSRRGDTDKVLIPSLLRNAISLGHDVCKIVVQGDGLTASREILRRLV